MTDILEMVKAALTASVRAVSLPALLLLAVVVVDRGRKAAAAELAEDSKERRAA